MKTLKEILYLTYHDSEDKWVLSFERPEFAGGESFEISKEEAKKLYAAMN